MKRKPAIRCLSAAAAVLLALTGCNKTPASSGSSQGSASGSGPIATSGPLAPYEETVHITYPAVIWDGINYVEGESLTDNFITKTIREKLNVQWDAAFTVPLMDLWAQLNLAMSTNSLPDVFYTDNLALASELIKNDMVQPLEEYIEQYATDSLKEIMGFNNGVQYKPVTVDGRIYGCPAPEDALNRTPVVFIRTDWMNKLGTPEPETLDDLLEIARAFTFNDPDGNGQNDTWGIPIDQYFGFVGSTMYTFANPMGAYYRQWVEKDGKLEWGSVQPEMKQALLKMQQAFKEGLFDPDFYTKTSVENDLANGKYGIMLGVFHTPTNLLANHYNKYGADWSVYPIPAQENGKHVTQIDLASRNYIFVRKGFEHPEALIKTLSLYSEMLNGSQAEWYTQQSESEKYKEVSGNFHMYLVPCQFADPMGNYNMGLRMAEALDNNDASVLKTPGERKAWDTIKAGGALGWQTEMYLAKVMPVIKNYVDDFHYSAYFGPPTETETSQGNDLGAYENGIFQMIIAGEEDISAFDLFVEEWYKKGGQQWTDEVNAWYAAQK